MAMDGWGAATTLPQEELKGRSWSSLQCSTFIFIVHIIMFWEYIRWNGGYISSFFPVHHFCFWVFDLFFSYWTVVIVSLFQLNLLFFDSVLFFSLTHTSRTSHPSRASFPSISCISHFALHLATLTYLPHFTCLVHCTSYMLYLPHTPHSLHIPHSHPAHPKMCITWKIKNLCFTPRTLVFLLPCIV